MSLPRILHVVFPNWPFNALYATTIEEVGAIIVSESGQVVGASPASRSLGVELGMPVRSAKAIDHTLIEVRRQMKREEAVFTEFLKVIVEFSPFFSSLHTGSIHLPLSSIMRLHGSEATVLAQLQAFLNRCEFTVAKEVIRIASLDISYGIAEGVFASRMAAYANTILPEGTSAEFIETVPISMISAPEISELLIQLGITTVGAFAAMDATHVASRFGRRGANLHVMAKGEKDLHPALIDCEEDLAIHLTFDEDVGETERVLFALSSPITELMERLRSHGLTATTVLLEVKFAGAWISRVWHFPDGPNERDLLDRCRWQLDGISKGLVAVAAELPPGFTVGYIEEIRIEVIQRSHDQGRQIALSGDPMASAEAVIRSLARIRSSLGEDAVQVMRPGGGRSPSEMVVLVPWEEHMVLDEERKVRARQRSPKDNQAPAPWPGRMIGPAPALVHESGKEVALHDAEGRVVGIDGRGMPTSAAIDLIDPQRRRRRIITLEGPWYVEEQWWNPTRGRRYARLLIELEDGTVHLVIRESGKWFLEATYD